MITYVLGPFEIENKKLFQSVDIGGIRKLVDFDANIIWSKQTESTIEFWHGKLLKTGSTYNDYYGFDTSHENAIKEAKYLAEQFSITKESSLVIKVRRTVKRIPYVRTDKCEKSNLNDLSKRHALEWVDSMWRDENDMRIEQKILEENVIWSSNEA